MTKFNAMYLNGTAKLSDKMVHDIIYNGGLSIKDETRMHKIHQWAARRWGPEVVSKQLMDYCLKELEEICKNR